MSFFQSFADVPERLHIHIVKEKIFTIFDDEHKVILDAKCLVSRREDRIIHPETRCYWVKALSPRQDLGVLRNNKNSEPFACDFLTQQGYGGEGIITILRLIAAADAHQAARDDEAVIVDADNLSKLCIEHLREKYQKSEWMKLCGMWEREFPQRMKTEKGKALFPQLLRALKNSIHYSQAP